MKRLMHGCLAAMLAFTLGVPAAALAESGDATGSPVQNEESPLAEQAAEAVDAQMALEASRIDVEPSAPDAQGETADRTLTVRYYEFVYEDGGHNIVGDALLGEASQGGFKPGDVVNAWDYVVDIPGHFFFDGSAPEIVISEDDAENVLDLFYGKLYNNEFTVNYYLMVGADLSADSWSGALATHPEFEKMGEQTFVDQRFDDLVEGDDYEYDIGGMYAVDTYPESIRLSTDPDENVINVLYVPALSNLPDDIVIPDEPSLPDGGNPPSGGGGTDSPITPTPIPPEVIVPAAPDAAGTGTGSFSIPSDASQLQGMGDGSGSGDALINDGMLANPVPQQTAERYINAFETGEPLVTALPAVEVDEFPYLGLALILYLIAFVSICAWAYERERRDSGAK